MGTYLKNQWRLIINSVGKGDWNMAVDEAILEFVAKKIEPPTLRLYAWNPYCLSLGHAQPIEDVDRFALSQRGWDLVRRPTGGKAILHADEITYSIAAPEDEPSVSGTVLESYKRLSQALLLALEELGIEADAKPKDPANRHTTINPICFESPSDFEITWSGRKIIGSAQARRLKGVLQHGSIPLFGNITRIVQVLNYSSPSELKISAALLANKACTLFDITKYKMSWHKVAKAITDAFSNALNIKFIQESFSRGELERAWELVENKYGNEEWTSRF
jgi:lipoyl(octanoyl) transferase